MLSSLEIRNEIFCWVYYSDCCRLLPHPCCVRSYHSRKCEDHLCFIYCVSSTVIALAAQGVVLSWMGRYRYVRPPMVRFSAVLVINRILILVFVFGFWVCFFYSISELGMFFFTTLSRTIPTTTGWLINWTNGGIYFFLTLYDSSRAHYLSVVNNCHSDHFFLPRARASAKYQPSQPRSQGLFPGLGTPQDRERSVGRRLQPSVSIATYGSPYVGCLYVS